MRLLKVILPEESLIFLDFQWCLILQITADRQNATVSEKFVSRNGCKLNLAHVKCGIHQGSLVGSLSYLAYMSYLRLAIKYTEVGHILHETDLVNSNNSAHGIKKQVNHDLIN